MSVLVSRRIELVKTLREYQKNGVTFGLSVVNPGFFWDMRLGKCLLTITLSKLWQCKKVLISAPYTTLQGWRDTIREETSTKLIVLNGKTAERFETLNRKYPIQSSKYFFLSKEGHIYLPQIKNFYWDLVCLDESTFIKTPESVNLSQRHGKTDNAAKFYCNNFRDSRHRVILTGTPNPESDLNYFQQLKFLDWKYVHPYKNFYDYRQDMCVFLPFKRQWYLTKKGRNHLNATLKKYTMVLKRSDVGIKENKIYQTVLIERDRTFNRLLKPILDKMELRDSKGNLVDLTVWPMVRYLWYHQLCGGFIGDEFVYNHKMRTLKTMLTKGELINEKAVIYVSYLEELNILHKNLHSSAVIYSGVPEEERILLRKQFKKHAFKYLICMPECVKTGVDLSFVDTIIYYSSTAHHERRKQTEDRIIKVGDTTPKLIIDMIVEDSVDEDIYYAHKNKSYGMKFTNTIHNRMRREIKTFYQDKTRCL